MRVAGKRKVTAQRLSESKFSAPHYYLRIDVEMDRLLEARQRLNASPAAQGRKVSLNAFLMKLTAETLRRHPEINATWEGETILQHGSIDLGLAVALPDGLVAPVVRGCGGKGLLAIDGELAGLVEKARANRLSLQEMSGATFTISNLGSYGILDFTAIINPPGSAILAVGRIQREPVVTGEGEEEELEIRSRMILTLSCDHRVIDGAVGAAFLADLKQMLEDPLHALYRPRLSAMITAIPIAALSVAAAGAERKTST